MILENREGTGGRLANNLISVMLRFNPENYLTFTPNSEDKLQASFIIANPSNNCSAPFKIKSTKPELFSVRPHIGVILPLQQVQVTISTHFRSTPDFARQLAHEHKFKVEYSMLQRAPGSINDALSKITDANKQTHKLYINAPTPKGMHREDHSDAKSSLSNRLSYRTARDQNEDPALHRFESDKREGLVPSTNEEKFEYLKGEIDKLEKERSEAIMAAKPSRRINILTAVLIFLFMIVVGNLTGKLIGNKTRGIVSRPKRKPREYKYFGLQKLWAKDEPQAQQASWWKFWS